MSKPTTEALDQAQFGRILHKRPITRDWLVTDRLDRQVLSAAEYEAPGAWLPWRGSYARTKRLFKMGLLKEAGIAAMPPHVLYVVTDKGREELAIADCLAAHHNT